jgi:hypothetical protein
MTTTPNDKVILYPAGGCFNRMRSEQTYLNDLLLSSFDGWEKAENKKQFVCEMILGKIPGGIWIHDRESGKAIRPEKKDAENRILQVSIAGSDHGGVLQSNRCCWGSSLVGHLWDAFLTSSFALIHSENARFEEESQQGIWREYNLLHGWG